VTAAVAGRTMKLMGNTLTAAMQWVKDRLRRGRPSRPPEAGVREPRRPKPTLPAAAIALAEPHTQVRRWIRLRNLRDTDEA
jgi:hypothetical protein